MLEIVPSPRTFKNEPTSLLNLPDEMLRAVVDALAHDNSSLAALARTCKTMLPICRLLLYRTLSTASSSEVLVTPLVNPQLASLVRSFQVTDTTHLPFVLPVMKNLSNLTELRVQAGVSKRASNWDLVTLDIQVALAKVVNMHTLKRVVFPARLSSKILRRCYRITHLRLYVDEFRDIDPLSPDSANKENERASFQFTKPPRKSVIRSLLLTGSRKRLTPSMVSRFFDAKSCPVDITALHALGVLGDEIADLSAIQELVQQSRDTLRDLLLFIGLYYPSQPFRLDRLPNLKSLRFVTFQQADFKVTNTCLIEWIAESLDTMDSPKATPLQSLTIFPWLCHDILTWRWEALDTVLTSSTKFSTLRTVDIAFNAAVISDKVIVRLRACLPKLAASGKLKVRAVPVIQWTEMIYEGF